MEVGIDELKKITNSLFSYLDENNITEVALEKDYYWNIPQEARYEIEEEPNELTIGQLSEDWEFLTKSTKGEYTVGYGFVWLSSIFRAIGENTI